MVKKQKQTECNDKNCPIHHGLKTRGRTFKGKVVSAKAQLSAVVEWPRTKSIPKYERYEKRNTKIQVHNPECINAKENDFVEIKECRPLSKRKKFVITKIIDSKKE
jgi:small subunit ribosomal protein S17